MTPETAHEDLTLRWLKTWGGKPYPPMQYEDWLEQQVVASELRLEVAEKVRDEYAYTKDFVLAGMVWQAFSAALAGEEKP
jgi:hypothetical protein